MQFGTPLRQRRGEVAAKAAEEAEEVAELVIPTRVALVGADCRRRRRRKELSTQPIQRSTARHPRPRQTQMGYEKHRPAARHPVGDGVKGLLARAERRVPGTR